MTHLVKIPLNHADMFVRSIGEGTITYDIRDKEKGTPMEPIVTSPLIAGDGKLYFDKDRFITFAQFSYLNQVLGDLPAERPVVRL